jgi:sigma54-dependent transcription regulator
MDDWNASRPANTAIMRGTISAIDRFAAIAFEALLSFCRQAGVPLSK